MYLELCRELARKLGAARALVVGLGIDDTLCALGLPDGVTVASPLAGEPVACIDVKALGREARSAGNLLVVDNTLPTWAGRAAVRLGAHLSVEPMSEGVTLVGVSKDAQIGLPELPLIDDEAAAALLAALPLRESAWRSASDTAQVVATYLMCHPRVADVRYPGLKRDPSFEVAARTLTGGFGPLVDYRLHGDEAWQRVSLAADTDPRAEIMRLEQLL